MTLTSEESDEVEFFLHFREPNEEGAVGHLFTYWTINNIQVHGRYFLCKEDWLGDEDVLEECEEVSKVLVYEVSKMFMHLT